MNRTDTNKVELNKVPYEVDGKVLFTETVERICDKYKDVFEQFGNEWNE